MFYSDCFSCRYSKCIFNFFLTNEQLICRAPLVHMFVFLSWMRFRTQPSQITLDLGPALHGWGWGGLGFSVVPMHTETYDE
ncbi:hypothetical protein Q5P01_021776 [Channa striata]|uniref:Uncharacterized protein n=1 Tax=Channa striata TaxID=64152 RepID=A0AA88RZE9_CHASR|nr:hypothetical protein Q5P01_021776 [Channa striata]